MANRTQPAWPYLTRFGIPEFRVIRRPIVTQGITIAVGSTVTPDTFLRRERLRQMYEQRLIEPVGELVKAPVIPSRAITRPSPNKFLVAAAVLDLDLSPVPVHEEASRVSGYVPSRKKSVTRKGVRP
jgi:hypothetical protein